MVGRATRNIVAIATTVWLKPNSSRGVGHDDVCGIVKWCRDVSRFAAALPVLMQRDGVSAGWDGRADVVVSTNDESFTRSECPQPRIIHSRIDPSFLELSDAFARTAYDRPVAKRRIKESGNKNHLSPEPFDRAMFAKWVIVNLVRYRAVLFVDNDVDFLEFGRRSSAGVEAYLAAAARVWAEEVPRFLASPARLLGSADNEAPINAGILWIKPSRAYYDEGVALLRTMRFSPELGFNFSGRPLDLMPREMAQSHPFNATRMVRLNSWNIVTGASDQGLFPLVFLMRHGALELTRRSDFLVHHFWSSSKPWVRVGSCLPFFHQLGIVDAPGDERGRTEPPKLIPQPAGRQEGVCWAHFRSKAKALITGAPSARWRWRCRGASFRLF